MAVELIKCTGGSHQEALPSPLMEDPAGKIVRKCLEHRIKSMISSGFYRWAIQGNAAPSIDTQREVIENSVLAYLTAWRSGVEERHGSVKWLSRQDEKTITDLLANSQPTKSQLKIYDTECLLTRDRTAINEDTPSSGRKRKTSPPRLGGVAEKWLRQLSPGPDDYVNPDFEFGSSPEPERIDDRSGSRKYHKDMRECARPNCDEISPAIDFQDPSDPERPFTECRQCRVVDALVVQFKGQGIDLAKIYANKAERICKPSGRLREQLLAAFRDWYTSWEKGMTQAKFCNLAQRRPDFKYFVERYVGDYWFPTPTPEAIQLEKMSKLHTNYPSSDDEYQPKKIKRRSMAATEDDTRPGSHRKQAGNKNRRSVKDKGLGRSSVPTSSDHVGPAASSPLPSESEDSDRRRSREDQPQQLQEEDADQPVPPSHVRYAVPHVGPFSTDSYSRERTEPRPSASMLYMQPASRARRSPWPWNGNLTPSHDPMAEASTETAYRSPTARHRSDADIGDDASGTHDDSDEPTSVSSIDPDDRDTSPDLGATTPITTKAPSISLSHHHDTPLPSIEPESTTVTAETFAHEATGGRNLEDVGDIKVSLSTSIAFHKAVDGLYTSTGVAQARRIMDNIGWPGIIRDEESLKDTTETLNHLAVLIPEEIARFL